MERMNLFKASLALNIILLGLSVGFHVPALKEIFTEKRIAEQKLPPEKYQTYRAAIEKAKENKAAVKKKMQAIHTDMMAALAAPTFNEANYRQKAEEMKAAKGGIMDGFIFGIMNAVKNFSAKERAVIAEDIRQHRANRKGSKN